MAPKSTLMGAVWDMEFAGALDGNDNFYGVVFKISPGRL